MFESKLSTMLEYKFDEMQNDENQAPMGDEGSSEEQGAPVEETPMEAPASEETPAEGGSEEGAAM